MQITEERIATLERKHDNLSAKVGCLILLWLLMATGAIVTALVMVLR